MGWRFTWDEWHRYRAHWDGCAFCGGPQQCIAAMVAWRWGGKRDIGNAVPACFQCRKAKSTRFLTVWLKAQRNVISVLTGDPDEVAQVFGLERQLARHLKRSRARLEGYRSRAMSTSAYGYRRHAARAQARAEVAEIEQGEHDLSRSPAKPRRTR